MRTFFRSLGVWAARDGCWCPGSVCTSSTWFSWLVMNNSRLHSNLSNFSRGFPSFVTPGLILASDKLLLLQDNGLISVETLITFLITAKYSSWWCSLQGCVSLGMFLVPVPLVQESQGGAMFQALRLLGLLPLVIVGVIFYLWLIVRSDLTLASWREIYNSFCLRSRFKELGETEKSDEDQCCPMRLKTGCEREESLNLTLILQEYK